MTRSEAAYSQRHQQLSEMRAKHFCALVRLMFASRFSEAFALRRIVSAVPLGFRFSIKCLRQ